MKLITSSSPHIRSGETTRRLMGTVLLALLPTLAAGVWFFGLRALLLTLVLSLIHISEPTRPY